MKKVSGRNVEGISILMLREQFYWTIPQSLYKFFFNQNQNINQN